MPGDESVFQVDSFANYAVVFFKMSRFIFTLTDWLVLPLRKAIPPVGSLDTASLVGAFLLQLVEFALLWLLQGMAAPATTLPVLALVEIGRAHV